MLVHILGVQLTFWSKLTFWDWYKRAFVNVSTEVNRWGTASSTWSSQTNPCENGGEERENRMACKTGLSCERAGLCRQEQRPFSFKKPASRLRVCLNRMGKRNRTAQSEIVFISISTKVSQGVQTESKSETRNPGEKQRRAQPTWAVRNCAHMLAIQRSATHIHHRSRQTRRKFDSRTSLGLPWRWWRV